MRLTRAVTEAILRAVFATQPAEIECGECFAELDRYVEMELAGKGAAQALPLVRIHVERCRDCLEKYEALMDVLRVISQ